MNKINEAVDKYYKSKTEMVESIDLNIKSEIANILKDSTIETFKFDAYTPYFMDGDTCVYSVNVDYGYINGEYIENIELSELDEEDYNKLHSLLECIPDDYYLEKFEDHQSITVHKNGDMTSEYLEHD